MLQNPASFNQIYEIFCIPSLTLFFISIINPTLCILILWFNWVGMFQWWLLVGFIVTLAFVTNLYNNRAQIIYGFYHFSSPNVISSLIVWIKMRKRYWWNLDLFKRTNLSVKLSVPLGFAVIILLSKLENLNAILFFLLWKVYLSFLVSVLYFILWNIYYLWNVSSLFSVCFHYRLSIRKRNHSTWQGGFLFPGQLVRDCC